MPVKTEYLKLHFIVFLWGFSAILGNLVEIPAVEMVLYRALLASAGMAVVILVMKGTFAVTPKQLLQLFLVGTLVAVHWVAFFGSARVANVSVSLVGFATNSLWAALLEPLFNRSKIKKFELLLGLVVLSALYLIFSFRFQYYLGLALGVLAGFTSALFSVFNSRLVRKIPSSTITFYEMGGTFISLLIFLPIYQALWATGGRLQLLPSAEDILWISLLAFVCSVYAYAVAIELMKKITVFMLQLTLNLEPLYGIVMAVIIFGERERMGWNFYAGTVIILAAVLVYPWLKRRYDSTLTPG